MSDVNDVSDTKYGFKDKEKAQETLALLANHDLQYRKLTVRGLLARAKRVLTSRRPISNLTKIIIAFKSYE